MKSKIASWIILFLASTAGISMAVGIGIAAMAALAELARAYPVAWAAICITAAGIASVFIILSAITEEEPK